MASTICGPHYTGKSCECRAQVTPGVTPATGEASNPTWICAHVQDGIQVGCDPGCCPTDCSAKAAADAKAATPGTGIVGTGVTWWIILVSIMFGLMLFISYFYSSTRRSNAGRPYLVIGLTASAFVTMVVTTIVMLTKK